MTAPARIRREDVKRMMAGARDAGFSRVRLTIDPVGNVVIDAGDDLGPVEPGARNPLDRIFEDGA